MARPTVDRLYLVFRDSASYTESEQYFNYIIQQAKTLVNAHCCCLALFDKISREFYYFKGCGAIKNAGTSYQRIKSGSGIIGWIAKHVQPVRLANARADPRFVKEVDEPGNAQVKSLMAVPMVSRNELIGVLKVANLTNRKNKKAFTLRDQKLLTILATHAALFIDNLRLVEENLSQAKLSDLGHSIASSAHGLKNILNNLDGGAYIVERGVSTKNIGMVNEGWDILKRNSQRMRDMVLDLLLFSRPGAPQYMKTNINKLCRDLYELVYESAREKKIEVILDLDPDVAEVCIDPKGIHRCVLNLIGNAFDACNKKHNYVRIKTRVIEDSGVQISVSDNGRGISKANLEHIFDVFFSTKGARGTGLGLAVTKRIISEHNGTIEVQSSLGKGSTFTITLPRTDKCD